MEKQFPYQSFGRALKELRSKAAKSPAEVSGAVEIDETKLTSYESGAQRPSEDIMVLLLQHFSVKDDKADELWRLAGYMDTPTPEQVFGNDEFGGIEEISMQIPVNDTRIIYTDMLQVMVNNYGVIMNFMQGAGPHNQPVAAARVGMSKEHARTVIDVLQKTLDQADIEAKRHKQQKEPKQLASGENDTNSSTEPKKA
jgi:transcriptional regulator with XRE-family HTH domain